MRLVSLEIPPSPPSPGSPIHFPFSYYFFKYLVKCRLQSREFQLSQLISIFPCAFPPSVSRGRGLAEPPFPPSCICSLFLFIIIVIISKPDLHHKCVWGVFKDCGLLLWETGPGLVGFQLPPPSPMHTPRSTTLSPQGLPPLSSRHPPRPQPSTRENPDPKHNTDA